MQLHHYMFILHNIMCKMKRSDILQGWRCKENDAKDCLPLDSKTKDTTDGK